VLGGAYESEEMLQEMWEAESCKEKTKSKCVPACVSFISMLSELLVCQGIAL